MELKRGSHFPALAIIIASRDVEERIRAQFGSDPAVLVFRHLEELDYWRNSAKTELETLSGDVSVALCQLGCELKELPSLIWRVIDRLRHSREVGRVEDLFRGLAGGRTFYRYWDKAIPEHPGCFLRRVRTLYAARLIQEGISPKEAAYRAGFSSVAQFHRSLKVSPRETNH